MWAAVSLSLLLLAATPEAQREEEEGGPRVAPVAAAVFPGLIFHGSGHLVAGHRETGWRLLGAQGIGLGAAVGGLAAVALTGASRRTIAPVAATVVAGAGLLITPWFADLYGVLAPRGGTGEPLRREATLEARVGGRYVYDPTLAYRTLLGGEADLRWRALRLTPAAYAAPGGENTRLGLHGAYRLLGPRPDGPEAADGSFLDLVAGGARDRLGPEALTLTALGAEARGRYDLRRFAPTLGGSFVEGGLGLGLDVFAYRTGLRATDTSTLLLARFGFGCYLGRGRGEIQLYYDHRHDGDAGGLKVPGLGSGVAGHFGLDALARLSPRWGVRVEAQTGSAHVLALALVHRTGGAAR